MRLRDLRTQQGMTREELAARLGTEPVNIARWESGDALLSVRQAKDLCMVLHCTVEELLGWEIEPEEWPETPFAVTDTGTPYGTLTIETTVGHRQFPIDERARESLLEQLEPRKPLHAEGTPDGWLYAWTLNNKILLLNPAFVRNIELIGDDVEAMPGFEHPEVYRALDGWGHEAITGQVRKACERLIAELGEERALQLATDLRVTYDNGKDEWSYLNEEVVPDLFALEFGHAHVPRSAFVELAQEGHYRSRFVNLEHVVAIEIPAERYHRLSVVE
ncbi:helix-turn-helix transcriptional regulator [Thiohalomonas denitrificans]|uniref:helix-turn-helix transcriptional regulator n=1 Tax=Thiohalomonas denitrificans TaxID=415747 RepID=UPI0026F0250E|nr:helix-turn-helix transcriptional regulator [Thiohalomonas denitrificans]